MTTTAACQGSGQEVTSGGWYAGLELSPQETASSDQLTVYAICAK